MINETHIDLVNIIQQYKLHRDDKTIQLAALETIKLYFIDKMLDHPKMLEQNTFKEIVEKATTIAKLYLDS